MKAKRPTPPECPICTSCEVATRGRLATGIKILDTRVGTEGVSKPTPSPTPKPKLNVIRYRCLRCGHKFHDKRVALRGPGLLNLAHKSPAIVELVVAVRSSHGDVRIVDYWPDDAHTIGFERTTTDEAMVSVTTKDKPPGRYDVTVSIPDREAADDPYLGSGCYSDCVIDGVLATIRKYVTQTA